MALHLCIECGAKLPRGAVRDRSAPCSECGGAPPRWRKAPVTLGGIVRRPVKAAVYVAAAGVCVATIVATCFEWASPLWPLRLLQVVLAVLLLVVGGLFTLKLGLMARDELFHRDHVHDEAALATDGGRADGGRGRRGFARTVLGRVVRAGGTSTRAPVPFDLSTFAFVRGLSAFAHARTVGAEVGRALRVPQPRAAEVAVLVSLLGLAARRRCEILVETTRAWTYEGGWTPRRAPDQHRILVRRAAPGLGRLLETGWLEVALLAALDGLGGDEGAGGPGPAVRPAPLGPYRAGARAPAAGGEKLVPAEALAAALGGTEPGTWLAGKLRDEARRARGQGELRATPAWAGPVFGAALRGSAGPLSALLGQIGDGVRREAVVRPS